MVRYTDGTPVVGATIVHPGRGRIGVVDATGALEPTDGFDDLWDTDGTRLMLDGRRLHIRSGNYRQGTLDVWRGDRTVHGHLIDRNGRGIPGSTVVLKSHWSGQRRATTAADGAFRFSGVTPSQLSITVEGDLVCPYAREDSIAESEADTPATLHGVRARPLRVTVKTADGKPLQHALTLTYTYREPAPASGDAGREREWSLSAHVGEPVTLRIPPGQDLAAAIAAQRASKGRYGDRRFAGLGALLPDAMDVTLHEPGYRPRCVLAVRCRDAATGDDVTPTLALARRVDRPWEVARKARVTSSPWPICVTHELRDPAQPGKVWDRRGYEFVVVQDLEPGPVELMLWLPGHAPVYVRGEARPFKACPPTDAQFAAGGTAVRVTLTDPDSGRPWAEGEIRVEAIDGGHYRRPGVFTSAVRVPGGDSAVQLPPGRYRCTRAAGRYDLENNTWLAHAEAREFTVPGPPVTLELPRR